MRYLFLLLFFVSKLIFAQGDCPTGSIKVEFMSPVSGKKKILCQVKKAGKFETVADLSDSNGDGRPAVQQASAPAAPGTDIKTISKNIQELFKILTSEQQKNLDKTSFNVNLCDKNKIEWINLFLTNSKRKVAYRFDKECDVEGDFVALVKQPFPMKLKLRHLSNYTQTEMMVILEIKMTLQSINLRFESPQGVVISPDEKVLFKGFYTIDIDAQTGGPFIGTGKGEVTILKVNDKVVNVTTPIMNELN